MVHSTHWGSVKLLSISCTEAIRDRTLTGECGVREGMYRSVPAVSKLQRRLNKIPRIMKVVVGSMYRVANRPGHTRPSVSMAYP